MPNASTKKLAPVDLDALDLEGFLAELRALRRDVDGALGEADLAHLRRIERLGWAATALGVATAWIAPNPLSMASLSFGRSIRWLLMHHIGHRGYDKVPGVPPRWTSKVFARGKRRFVDWADWMVPEAWIYEHNVLHHSHTGEERDPDLLERNTESLRDARVPKTLKYGAMGLLALSWRPFYYAPKTMQAWVERHGKRDGHEQARGSGRELWLRCYLPYAALELGLFPLAFFPLGPWAIGSALANSIGAEALTNLHTFLVVGPNHSGEDLYRFSSPPRTRAEAMLHQVIGSANYAVGGDGVDLAHLWLNYQIEHHIWPDLPMLRYRELQPKVKALCAKYGIPYVQESVLTRVKKMLAVAVGSADMKRAPIRRPASVCSRALPTSP